MSRVSPDLLARCLADLRTGQATIEDCVAAHPLHAEELRSLLETAAFLTPPPPVAMDPACRLRMRVALVETISAETNITNGFPGHFWKRMLAGWQRPSGPVISRAPMTALVIALVVTITSALGAGATFASQDALPGDTLYSVKTIVEELQVRLAPGDEARAEARAECAAKRLDEAERAVEVGRTDSALSALDRMSQCLEQSEQHLIQAAAAGRPVVEVATRLSESLARRQAELEAIQSRVPEPAKDAVQKAIDKTEKGLDTATSLADKKDSGSRGSGNTSAEPVGGTVPLTVTVPITPTVTPAPTATPLPGGDEGPRSPLPTVSISSTLSITLTQAVSDVQKLKDDPVVPGDSEEGLLAKLRAARESLERGRTTAALNQLEAFLSQLNAMRRSGHIGDANYNALYADYQRLMLGLGGTPDPQAPPKDKPGNGNRPDDAEKRGNPKPEQPVIVPTATPIPAKPTPTPAPATATATVLPPTPTMTAGPAAPTPTALPPAPTATALPPIPIPAATPAVEKDRPVKPDENGSTGRPDERPGNWPPDKPAPPASAAPGLPVTTQVPSLTTPVPPVVTQVPPVVTPVPPAATQVPPVATQIPPAATQIPPAATQVPPAPDAAPDPGRSPGRPEEPPGRADPPGLSDPATPSSLPGSGRSAQPPGHDSASPSAPSNKPENPAAVNSPVPKPATPEPAAARPDPASQANPNPGIAKPEVPKAENPGQGSPKPESPNLDAGPETPKADSPKPENPKVDSPAQDSPKPENPKLDVLTPENLKPEPAKSEETAKQDSPKRNNAPAAKPNSGPPAKGKP